MRLILEVDFFLLAYFHRIMPTIQEIAHFGSSFISIKFVESGILEVQVTKVKCKLLSSLLRKL